MKLEHFGFAEPGDCRVVFTASAEELAEAVAAEQAGEDPPADEEDLLTAAVNRAILTGFSTLYSDLLKTQHILPVTDPDFELLAVHKAEGFRAGAQFFCLPPLELGRYTGFVQPIRPRPIRQLNIELEINQHHGDADRAADAAGNPTCKFQTGQTLIRSPCRNSTQQCAALGMNCIPFYRNLRHAVINLNHRAADAFIPYQKIAAVANHQNGHFISMQNFKGSTQLLCAFRLNKIICRTAYSKGCMLLHQFLLFEAFLA